MEIHFDFGIERCPHRLQFVEQLPARLVVPWIEPLHDMDAAEYETVIQEQRHRVERTDRPKSLMTSARNYLDAGLLRFLPWTRSCRRARGPPGCSSTKRRTRSSVASCSDCLNLTAR